MSYNYEEMMEDAFKEVISVTSSLSSFHQKKVISKLKLISREIKKKDDIIKSLKENKYKWYDDDLEYCIDILQIAGYTYEDVRSRMSSEFIYWFKNNALTNQRYKAKLVSTSIIIQFYTCYNMFSLDFSRDPSNYEELRDYMLNTESILNEKHKKEIQKLEYGIRHRQTSKEGS